jgi:hypothetical protein
MGIAIPREAGGQISGTAAVRRGSAATKNIDRYILERTRKVYVKGSDEDCRPPEIL